MSRVWRLTLLHYPYLTPEQLQAANQPSNVEEAYATWYYRSCFLNHHNFTQMLRYTVTREQPAEPLERV